MKLKIIVLDKNNKRLFCKILLNELTFDVSENVRNRIEKVYCNGEFEVELNNGIYGVNIYRGKLYQPFRKLVELLENDITLEVQLNEVLDVKSLNLYSFDAHSHVSRDEILETGNLVKASTVMKGEDFNFFFAGSPYDHETHLQYLNKNFTDEISYREKFSSIISKTSDDSFILDIGNEIVKCRYGHAFLMNYTQYPPFSKYYDHEFDPWLFTKTGDEPDYSISYIHEALLRERGENSVAVLAHPTCWWWHENGEFITNIAATIGFEILAGSIDAIVIMGYQSDKKYYQELWYDALKNGYFLPGMAEIDASFDTAPGDYLSFKTYTFIEEFSIDCLCRSVKEGRNIVSSGPIIIMRVNGQLPGAVLKHSQNDQFNLELEAYRCYQGLLSKIQIIVNGEIYKEFDICLGSFKVMETVSFNEDSFIIAKCYDFAGNVAITNPVYIRNKPFVNRGYLSDVRITVMKSGSSAKGIYWLDEEKEKISFEKEIQLKIKVSSKLNIQVEGQLKVLQLFELEELQKIFKNLYFGRFNKECKYKPGEVPAEQFKLKRIREILNHVELNVEF